MRVADQVVEKLLALVQASGVQPGQRLPAERQLAAELGVAPTTGGAALNKITTPGGGVGRPAGVAPPARLRRPRR